eukprot:scaffold752_cov196-Chaetoceros_neogracile.AAC.4
MKSIPIHLQTCNASNRNNKLLDWGHSRCKRPKLVVHLNFSTWNGATLSLHFLSEVKRGEYTPRVQYRVYHHSKWWIAVVYGDAMGRSETVRWLTMGEHGVQFNSDAA